MRGDRRLIFAEDFDQPRGDKPPAPPPQADPVFTKADILAARDAGWRDGHAAGLAECECGTAALTHHALTTIADRLDTARAEANAIAEATAEAVVTLLMAAFATAFPALAARHGETESRAVIRAILPGLREEPAVAVRLAPQAVEAVSAEIARHDPDLADRIRIIPTDAQPLGDITITWRAGSATRNTAALWAEIEAILAPAGLLPAPIRQKETEHVQ